MSSVEGVRGEANGAILRPQRALGNASEWLSERAWLVIPLLAIPALTTLISPGLPYSQDGVNHLIRLAALDRLLHAGAL